MAVGLAFGLTSLATYVWFILGTPGRLALLGLEALILVAVLAAPDPREILGLGAQDREHRPPTSPQPALLLRLAFAAALISAGMGVALTFLRFPDGQWDAVDIWNGRARTLVRAGLDVALSQGYQSDYPLLLPLSVAHLWTWLGEARWLPQALGAAVAGATGAVLYGTAARLSGRTPALVITTVWLASPFTAVFGAGQRADAPLALFMLATLAALLLHQQLRRPGLLLLAGLQMGCAAWTKNEGILFAGLAGLTWLLLSDRESRRGVALLALGALPFGLALIHHKLTCGSTTDLFRLHEGSIVELILDPSRAVRILLAFAREGALYALALVAVGWGLGPGRPAMGLRLARLAPLAMLASYFVTYLLTPRDLDWHLESSLNRLLYQLWPMALLAVAVSTTRGASAGPRNAHEAQPAIRD
jgi:hypothetical protein